MKKIIISFSAIIVIVIMYGYSQSGQNRIAENNSAMVSLNNPEQINDPGAGDSRVKKEITDPGNLPARIPSVLSILINEKVNPARSNSFLKKIVYGEPGKDGC